MHIADFSIGVLGANGVVAAGIPIAVGAAHGARLLGQDKVVVCFFGDGAINRGPFLEGLNWAGIFDLAILFVCEDNGFAATTRTRTVSAGPGPSARAGSLGIPALTIDGNDVAQVDDVAGELIGEIRAGGGPRFLTARTYRLKGHTAADPGLYRPDSEVEAVMTEEPVARLRQQLLDLTLDAAALDAVVDEARREMAAAAAAAAAAPHPAVAEAFSDVQDVGAVPWPN